MGDDATKGICANKSIYHYLFESVYYVTVSHLAFHTE